MFRASPEYLVRTGSLKNKVIPAESSRSLRTGPPAPSNNYAVYNIQTGCYTWQGRSVSHSNIIIVIKSVRDIF